MNQTEKPFSNVSFLVVDDDIPTLDMVVTLLKRNGAITYTAVDGAKGLDVARERIPDVIISDLSMPIMNGWKMIAALKQDHMTAGIPIIAFTAHAMNRDRDKVIEAGCHSYITKPINPYNFIAHLQQILADMPPDNGDESSLD